MDTRLDKLVRGGAVLGTYATVAAALVAAACADAKSISQFMPFFTAVGGSVIGGILQRAARKEEISAEELRQALLSQEELEIIRQLMEQHGNEVIELLHKHKIDIEMIADDVAQLKIDNREDHAEMLNCLITGNEEITGKLDILLQRTATKAGTPEEREEVLRAYAEAIIHSPRYTRMNTGAFLAEADRFQETIQDTKLDDIFVEPKLAGVVPLGESREETSRLYEQSRDDDLGAMEREQAQDGLLALRGRTLEGLLKDGEAQLASKAVEGKQAAVILGDPGTGKSTLLRWMLVRHAREMAATGDGRVPVYVPAGEYANACDEKQKSGLPCPLDSYLGNRVEEEHKGMLEVLEEALSGDGRGVLLLVDGLDEVRRDLRNAVVEGIQDFIADYAREGKTSRVIISSRLFGYYDVPVTSSAAQFAIVPFDDDQIGEFARKQYAWLEAHSRSEKADVPEASVEAERFREALFSQPHITDLARVPLLLTMIAAAFRSGKELPQHRVQLYHQTLEHLVTRWHQQRSRYGRSKTLDVSFEEVCEIWAPIARWMHEQKTNVVHEHDLRDKLEERLGDLKRSERPEEWLKVRGDACCLLQERGPKLFGFLHQTFQEYLAAMDICSNGEFVPELHDYIKDPHWHEVLRLACGYLGVIRAHEGRERVTSLLRRILDNESPFEKLLHRDLFLAASCVADDVRPKTEIEQEIVTRLLTLAAGCEMDSVREQAMKWAVANVCVPLEEAFLGEIERRLFRRGTWEIRYDLVVWLDRRAGPSPMPVLNSLHDSIEPSTRVRAGIAIWSRHPERTELARFVGLAQSERPDRHKEIMQTLRAYPAALTTAAITGKDWETIHTARALWLAGHRGRALPLLLQQLEEGVGAHCVWAAEILMESEYRDRAVALLEECLRSEHAHMRRIAAETLQRAGCTERALPTLAALLTGDSEECRLLAARDLLGTECEKQALSTLAKTARTYGLWQQEACDVLAQSGHHALLADILREEWDGDVVGRTMWAVWKHFASKHPEIALEQLRPAVEQGLQLSWMWAARLLWDAYRDERALEVALRVAAQGAQWEREAAICFLYENEHAREAESALISALESHDPDMRGGFIQTLASTKMSRTTRRAIGETLDRFLPNGADDLGPDDPLYKAAWLRAELSTRQGDEG